MKTIISTSEFKNALKVMDKIKEGDNKTVSDLLIKSSGYDTQLIKTNGQTTVIYTTKNSIEEEGKILLPMETATIIKKIKEYVLTITDSNIKTNKKTIDIKQPEMIDIITYDNIDLIFSVSQNELLRMLEVTYATAQENYRPILTGVYFNKNEVCALDGYRLSLRKSSEYTQENNFVVNGESIQILKSVLKTVNDIVNVYYISENNKNTVKFEIGNIIIVAECIQGEFLKYSSIIPQEHYNKSIVNAVEFSDELDFIKEADGRNFIKLILTKDNKIILKGNQCKEAYSEKLSDEDQKKRQEELNKEYKDNFAKWIGKNKRGKEPVRKEAKWVKKYDLIPVSDITSEISVINTLDKQEDYTIAFNPKYVIEALKQYKGNVNLQMTSVVNPMIITQDDSKGLELVLPVRIRA
jgi:DNA polymerase-3 subunit beta